MSPGRDTDPEPRSGTVTRGVGIVVAFVTAAVVFAGGQALLGGLRSQPPAPPPVVTPPPPPPPPPPPVVAPRDGATEAGAADAAAIEGGAAALARVSAADAASVTDGAPGSATPAPSAAEPVAAAAEPSPAPPAEPSSAAPSEDRGKSEASASERRSADHDKDAAREAWRKNYPDVAADDTRATILIPIKGSTDGSTFHLTKKPRSVVVSLPKAESLITMRVYPIKHDGFRSLWIKQDPSEGATLRLTMVPGTSPQVDIKEDYVRITMRKPSPGSE